MESKDSGGVEDKLGGGDANIVFCILLLFKKVCVAGVVVHRCELDSEAAGGGRVDEVEEEQALEALDSEEAVDEAEENETSSGGVQNRDKVSCGSTMAMRQVEHMDMTPSQKFLYSLTRSLNRWCNLGL